jgi:hypothetical protein
MLQMSPFGLNNESVDEYHHDDENNSHGGEDSILERDNNNTENHGIGRNSENTTATTTTTAATATANSNTTTTGARMQSLLLSRRTATRLEFTLQHEPPHDDGVDTPTRSGSPSAVHHNYGRQQQERHKEEEGMIRDVLNRAVLAGQMAPNHKRTEPFSFVRFVSSSQAAQRLADIAYHITLRKKNSSEQVAQRKRDKWLSIPAFLVTIVHENQNQQQAGDDHHQDDNATNGDKKLDVVDPYEVLKYMPPSTDRQLEDVCVFDQDTRSLDFVASHHLATFPHDSNASFSPFFLPIKNPSPG